MHRNVIAYRLGNFVSLGLLLTVTIPSGRADAANVPLRGGIYTATTVMYLQLAAMQSHIKVQGQKSGKYKEADQNVKDKQPQQLQRPQRKHIGQPKYE